MPASSSTMVCMNMQKASKGAFKKPTSCSIRWSVVTQGDKRLLERFSGHQERQLFSGTGHWCWLNEVQTILLSIIDPAEKTSAQPARSFFCVNSGVPGKGSHSTVSAISNQKSQITWTVARQKNPTCPYRYQHSHCLWDNNILTTFSLPLVLTIFTSKRYLFWPSSLAKDIYQGQARHLLRSRSQMVSIIHTSHTSTIWFFVLKLDSGIWSLLVSKYFSRDVNRSSSCLEPSQEEETEVCVIFCKIVQPKIFTFW